jgi:hypothetical protein
MTCSQCFGNELRRSRLRWYEYILRPLQIRPFRCTSCLHRALHFSRGRNLPSPTGSVR